jgi:serine/threonine-protein kinase HipA
MKDSSAPITDIADVLLGDEVIGELRCERGPDRIAFRFTPEYFAQARRPVLGVQFESDLDQEITSNLRVPSWFGHLLPEGQLRQILATHAHVSPAREFYLLARLGEDLAGAVRVRPRSEFLTPGQVAREKDAAAEADELRLSLAGMQLKLSAKGEGQGFTIPARGQGGDWIIKLAGGLPGLPENEEAMLTWARESGIEVPDHRLVEVREIRRMPSDFPQEGTALAVRRYDRTAGTRIHQEDFAQVLGKPAGELPKYEGNYETLGLNVLARAGLDDFRSLVRRLVFMVLSNNADAHLKNWSLIYPDKIHARLAPAYDLVYAGAYAGYGGKLALKLNTKRRFEIVGPADFRGFAQRVMERLSATMSAPPALDPAEVETWARDDAARALDAWATLRSTLPLPNESKSLLQKHLSQMPLARRR